MPAISPTSDLPKKRSSRGIKTIRGIGILSFGSSFLVPANLSDLSQIGGGFMAFIETPIWALIAATKGIQEDHWQGCMLGFLMVVGWASNFYIFLRLRLVGTLFAVASPWILFVGMSFLENVTGFSTVAIDFIPFYPWALGIALIQLSQLNKPRPQPEPRTIWTGF